MEKLTNGAFVTPTPGPVSSLIALNQKVHNIVIETRN